MPELLHATANNKGLQERGLASEISFLLEVLNSHYPENVLYVVYWGWEIFERVGGSVRVPEEKRDNKCINPLRRKKL